MPFFSAPHALVYYDVFYANITSSMSRKPILLIHGFASTPTNDFALHLPALQAHYTLLAPHLHGYGTSSHRTHYPITYYRDDVADLVALLDALHFDQVYVLGFSDGAIVSLLLSALHPQRVCALAILGGQPTVNEQDVAGLRHWLLETPLSEAWQRELAQLHGELYWRTLPEMYVKGQEALVAAGGVLISDEELAVIHCPTLIMHGQRDRIVPVAYAHTLHKRIAGSQLLLFDAGHTAHIRCQHAYLSAVLNFFDHSSSIVL